MWPLHIVGYHATELPVAQAVVGSGVKLIHSMEEKDWLGTGIYFWAYSLTHGIRWAEMRHADGRLADPAVLKMKIKLGKCLNIEEHDWHNEMVQAYELLDEQCQKLGIPLPQNERSVDGILIHRYLDCSVIDQMHWIRRIRKLPKYDTLIGAFPDGPEVFPGGSFHTKSHVQVAVRNYSCLSEPEVVWQEGMSREMLK